MLSHQQQMSSTTNNSSSTTTVPTTLPLTSTPSAGLRLTIGVVGFGNFGRFLAAVFARQGHRVIGQSRGDYSTQAQAISCEYVRCPSALMDCHPDVVIFCTSIMSLDTVLSNFPLHRLSGVLVADVLSVKLYPHDLFLRVLPSDADIVCTHPMFGPESGRTSWKALPFVYDLVRITDGRQAICEAFLDLWRNEMCRMVFMDCAQHDSHAASTQFITHTTGRMLAGLDVCTTPINTKGFESLLGVVDTTCKDSFDLFYGLYKYNPKARLQLNKLQDSLNRIRAELDAAEIREEEEKKK